MTRFSPSNSPSQTENGTIHEDFAKAIELMLRYAPRHQVAIHGYCRLHNHGHWILRKQGHPWASHHWPRLAAPFLLLRPGHAHWQTALRYVEWNAVRAHLARSAGAYPWSPARAHLACPL